VKWKRKRPENAARIGLDDGDGSGDVDLNDLAMLLSAYGMSCP